MSAWQPTHAAPSDGMWVWSEPDASAAPITQLAPHTPVQVIQTLGQWSRVTCDNGFTGWVDHSRLAAAGPAPAPVTLTSPAPVAGSRRRMVGAAVVVLLVVGVVIALLVSRSGDTKAARSWDFSSESERDRSTATDSSTASDPGTVQLAIAMQLPSGWTMSPDGTEVAENEADLGVDAPVGPVVRASLIDPGADTTELLTRLTDGLDGDDLMFGEAAAVDVNGFDAVAVVAHGGGRSRSFVIVHPPGTSAVLFRLDVPSDRFNSLTPTLASIPGVETG